MHRVKLAADEWQLVKLQVSLTYHYTVFNYALIKRADNGTIERGKINQLVHFKPVMNPETVQSGISRVEDYPYEILVLCR